MSAQGMAGMEPPFLQTFNPHRHSPVAWQWTLALLSAACALLGTERLRLYQTSLFWKRRGHDATAWHQDLIARLGRRKKSAAIFWSCTHKDLAAKVHHEQLEDTM
eukprot:g25438.t1